MINLRRSIELLLCKPQKNFFLKAVLFLPSLFFRFIVTSKNRLYEWKIFTEKEAPLTVISIGNICIGGSGKTPLALFLAKELMPHFRVGIVSRGYLSKGEKKEPLLLSWGAGPLYTAEEAGDEPLLLSQRLPEAIVVIGKDRLASVKCAAKAGAKLVILDDGMQHRKIKRHFEIVSVQGKEMEGSFFPLGSLRDERQRLKCADIIVWQGEERDTKEKIATWSHAPLVKMTACVNKATTFEGAEVSLKGVPLGVFCGIANPERFITSVKAAGAKILDSFILADHEKITKKELQDFVNKVAKKGAKMALCTEKDWIKIKNINIKTALPLAYANLELAIAENEEKWRHLIGLIKERVQ